MNKNQKLMINKFALKINSVLNDGGFRVNPNNG